MALNLTFKETTFGIGDQVRVHQNIIESGKKKRTQIFEGVVIAIKNRDLGKSFIVRRIGVQKIGIEQIFPLYSPTLEKVDVVRRGTAGVDRAKLYYIRGKSKKEIEKIYSRNVRREKAKTEKAPKKVKRASTKKSKKASKKSSKK
jgi:large subunit ribosomal protein L19